MRSGGSERVVRVPGWNVFPWLRNGFGTRLGGVSAIYMPESAGSQECDGDLNTGWTSDDDAANVVENRRRLVEAVANGDDPPAPLVTVRQIHSARSLVVPGEKQAEFVTEGGRAAFESDGLITGASGVFLGIQTADCVPVLVVDVKRRVVAAFHAGWRGTAAGIVEAGISQMQTEFGCRAGDLRAAVGPSIGPCCYTVGEQVRDEFAGRFGYTGEVFRRDSDGLHLDLWEANRLQLLDSGVAATGITVVAECSGCAGTPGRRKYFSHRCEHGFTGRMMSLIGTVKLE